MNREEYIKYFTHMQDKDQKCMLGGMGWDYIGWHIHGAVESVSKKWISGYVSKTTRTYQRGLNLREIIDTDESYQFSSDRPYPIIIYEYFRNGKVEKLHEGYIDNCIRFLCDIKEDISIIWTDYNNVFTEVLIDYLHKNGINNDMVCYHAYKYIKESYFKKRFVSYWIEIKPWMIGFIWRKRWLFNKYEWQWWRN